MERQTIFWQYLTLLEKEIKAAVEEQLEEIAFEREQVIHCMLENRKHIMAWMKEDAKPVERPMA